MKTKNTLKYFGLILVIVFVSSCKKDKTVTPTQQNNSSGNNAANPLVVDSIPEKIGYQKVFNVIERSTTTSTNGPATTQTLSTFSCTFSIIADTIFPNNTRGKKYKITDAVYPNGTFAYSYYGANDSIWYFKPLNYNEHIYNFNVKVPLTAYKTWTLNTFYGDSLKSVGQVSEPVNSINTSCYKVTGRCMSSTNYQYYNYAYFLNNKGVIKYIYDVTNFSNPSSINIIEKELNMTNSNF